MDPHPLVEFSQGCPVVSSQSRARASSLERSFLLIELWKKDGVRALDRRIVHAYYDVYLEEEHLVITDRDSRADGLILWGANVGHVLQVRNSMQLRTVRDEIPHSRVFPRYDASSLPIGEIHLVTLPSNEWWEIYYTDRDIRLYVCSYVATDAETHPPFFT
jgi:hypothetical protein